MFFSIVSQLLLRTLPFYGELSYVESDALLALSNYKFDLLEKMGRRSNCVIFNYDWGFNIIIT